MRLALSPLDAKPAYCGHSIPIITGSDNGAKSLLSTQTAQGVTVFDHVEIKVVRVDDCRRFYETVLAPFLIALKWADKDTAGFGRVGHDKVGFLIARGEQGAPCHSPSRQAARRRWMSFIRLASGPALSATGSRGCAPTMPPITTPPSCSIRTATT